MKEKDISYASLSRITGIDESKLKRIFSGRQSMTLEDRDTVCGAIGYNPVDVLLLTMEDQLSSISAGSILRLIDELPEDTRRALVALIIMLRKNHKVDR